MQLTFFSSLKKTKQTFSFQSPVTGLTFALEVVRDGVCLSAQIRARAIKAFGQHLMGEKVKPGSLPNKVGISF